jgi:hypothetical protein
MLQIITLLILIFVYVNAKAVTLFELCSIYNKSCIFVEDREPDVLSITRARILSKSLQSTTSINAVNEILAKHADINSIVTDDVVAEVEILRKPSSIDIPISNLSQFDFDELLNLFDVIVEENGDAYIFYQKAILRYLDKKEEGKVKEILERANSIKYDDKRKYAIVYPTIDISDFLNLCNIQTVECISIRDAVIVMYRDTSQLEKLSMFADTKKKKFKVDAYIALLSQEAKKDLEANIAFNFSTIPNYPNTTTGSGDTSTGNATLRLQRHFIDVGFKLKALEAKGYAKILSNPELIVDDRETATIGTGVQVPAITPATSNYPAIVTWKNAILGMQVTPYKLPNGLVKMIVEITKDFPDYTNRIGDNIPIQTNSIKTSFTLEEGKFYAIGGITEKSEAQSREAPAIPILSWILGSKKTETSDKELYIILSVEQL